MITFRNISFLFSSDRVLDQILDATPNMYELTKYATTAKWIELGMQQNLDVMKINQCKDSADIYKLWLDEKGSHATRRMLLAGLRDIGENAVVDRYVAYLKTMTMVSDILKDIQSTQYIIETSLL